MRAKVQLLGNHSLQFVGWSVKMSVSLIGISCFWEIFWLLQICWQQLYNTFPDPNTVAINRHSSEKSLFFPFS